MFDHYEDIKSRINEDPTWWDVHGTPRYGDIPEDIKPHARRIKCQECGRAFTVCLVGNVYRTYKDSLFGFVPVTHKIVRINGKPHELPDLYKTEIAKEGVPEHWHYGDPPNHGCIGDTMNSIPEYCWADD